MTRESLPRNALNRTRRSPSELADSYSVKIIRSAEAKISMIKRESKSWKPIDSEAWIIC